MDALAPQGRIPEGDEYAAARALGRIRNTTSERRGSDVRRGTALRHSPVVVVALALPALQRIEQALGLFDVERAAADGLQDLQAVLCGCRR
jgi:hypothetical protein